MNFWYKYQVHPFDFPRYFSVVALTQSSANELVIQHFTKLFESGQTVMNQFYPCEEPLTKKSGFRHWFANLFRPTQGK